MSPLAAASASAAALSLPPSQRSPLSSSIHASLEISPFQSAERGRRAPRLPADAHFVPELNVLSRFICVFIPFLVFPSIQVNPQFQWISLWDMMRNTVILIHYLIKKTKIRFHNCGDKWGGEAHVRCLIIRPPFSEAFTAARVTTVCELSSWGGNRTSRGAQPWFADWCHGERWVMSHTPIHGSCCN